MVLTALVANPPATHQPPAINAKVEATKAREWLQHQGGGHLVALILHNTSPSFVQGHAQLAHHL